MNRRNFLKRIGYAIAGGLSLPFLVKAKPNASPIYPLAGIYPLTGENGIAWLVTWKVGLNKEYEHKVVFDN